MRPPKEPQWEWQQLHNLIIGNSFVMPQDTDQVIKGLAQDLLDAYLKISERNALIHKLEWRLAKRKAVIANLEECRKFERETEMMLLAAICGALALSEDGQTQDVIDGLEATLQEYAHRRGPRPKEYND